MAEELNFEHFDLGTFVDYVYALKQERDALRAQLPSQGGEAVAIVCGSQVQWLPGAGKVPDRSPLYTQPADQVEDDLNMVKVSRELLERIIKRGMRLPDETQHQHLEELSALLASAEGVKDERG